MNHVVIADHLNSLTASAKVSALCKGNHFIGEFAQFLSLSFGSFNSTVSEKYGEERFKKSLARAAVPAEFSVTHCNSSLLNINIAVNMHAGLK